MGKRPTSAVLQECGQVMNDLLELGCPHIHHGEDVDQVVFGFMHSKKTIQYVLRSNHPRGPKTVDVQVVQVTVFTSEPLNRWLIYLEVVVV